MAVKTSELFSLLWSPRGELSGSMEATGVLATPARLTGRTRLL
jgi:hypothetical protein